MLGSYLPPVFQRAAGLVFWLAVACPAALEAQTGRVAGQLIAAPLDEGVAGAPLSIDLDSDVENRLPRLCADLSRFDQVKIFLLLRPEKGSKIYHDLVAI